RGIYRPTRADRHKCGIRIKTAGEVKGPETGVQSKVLRGKGRGNGEGDGDGDDRCASDFHSNFPLPPTLSYLSSQSTAGSSFGRPGRRYATAINCDGNGCARLQMECSQWVDSCRAATGGKRIFPAATSLAIT